MWWFYLKMLLFIVLFFSANYGLAIILIKKVLTMSHAHPLFIAIAVSFIALSTTTSAQAQQHVTASAGMFDIRHQERSAQFGLQWSGNDIYTHFQPIAGVNADVDKDAFAYGGVQYDYAINEKWSLTPSFAAGAFHHGDGKDLGGAINFRSALGVDYRLSNDSRIGLGISHISNAGIYKRNPGAESVMLTWSMPFGK
jgi:lipid A 3-O-deacylase